MNQGFNSFIQQRKYNAVCIYTIVISVPAQGCVNETIEKRMTVDITWPHTKQILELFIC